MNLDEFVLQVSTQERNISHLHTASPEDNLPVNNLHQEQRKDPKLVVYFDYLENDILLEDDKEARKTAALATKFVILDKILYFFDHRKGGRWRAVVPSHLQSQLLQEYHGGRMAGNFSGNRLYATLCCNWYWERVMLMPLLSAGTVRNVLWLLVSGERRGHLSTQFL